MPNAVSWNALKLSIAVLAAATALLLMPFISGLLGAAVLYVLTVPLLARVVTRRQRRAAAFGLMFACFFALVLPGIWLLGELLAQIPDAVREIQGSPAVQRVMAIRVGDIEVGTLAQRGAGDLVSWSSRQSVAVASGVLSATLNLVIALFGAYYLLTAPPTTWPRLRAVLPLAPTTLEMLRQRFHRVTEAMVLGVVLSSLSQGVLVGAALAVLGFPHYLLWGAATAIASILPVFGSGLVWLPAAAVLLARDRVGAAVFLLAYGALLVSNVDNALRLVVYRRVSQIHPMVTLVGAFAGVRAFGIAGLLLGPLVLSYTIELLAVQRAVSVGETPPTPGRVADTDARSPALT